MLKNILQKTFTTTVLFILVLTQQAFGQVIENFSDGDFTANPVWTGTDAKFIVLANQLKLQAAAATGTAYLSTPSRAINNASWEFFVKLNFNPSSTNYTKVYLTADKSDLSADLNGYYVLIGDTPDEVSLYRQTGSTKARIINGTDGRVKFTSVMLKIKVTRDSSGNWQLFSDVGPSGTYLSEGITRDTTHLSSGFMGVQCIYTATRADKFFFDDFVVSGDPFIDVVAPQWESLTVSSAQTLELGFNEPLNVVSAESISNFSASNGIGNPMFAELHADQRTITLTYAQPLPNGVEATLTVSGIKDTVGNTMNSHSKTFLFFEQGQVNHKDVVITEIFSDPSPSVGLPDVEFIEVYNRSNAPFDLSDWQITDGSSIAPFPRYILLPGDFLIVTSSSAEGSFSSYGKVVGLPGFPTLNNSGDALVLKNSDDQVIDSVNYSASWYHDDNKAQGGWSLEMIDIQNICAEGTNWIASESSTGGTPGAQNSVVANKPDLTGPRVISAIPINQNEIVIRFDEKLDKVLPTSGSFKIEPASAVSLISFTDESLTALRLLINTPLETGVVYTITIADVYDCAGNKIQDAFSTMHFGLPERADSLDIVINEVLFNPRPTGIDFIEVYNRSSKYINLKNWHLANDENTEMIDKKIITEDNFLIGPGAYLVFTTESNVLKGEYLQGREENFFEMHSLPSMNDDNGSIVLITDTDKVVDHFLYDDNMHSAFIREEEGVSLERISFTEPTNAPSNWKSASSVSGFATPGYVNSNAYGTVLGEDAIVINPEIFQPESDQPDFAQIQYHFNHGGFVANVKIFDQQGRKIKELANNEILGADGFFRWDGDQENGSKVRVGSYVVWFEVFDEQGVVQTFKKRIAIAGKF